MCVRVYVCVCVGAPNDYKGLGMVDHRSSGDRGVFVLCVYRHASAGLSIHVNMSKTPEGAACDTQKKIRN